MRTPEREREREAREHKDLPAFSGKMFARAVIRAGAIYHFQNAATLISVSGQTMRVILTGKPRVSIRLQRICRQRVEELPVEWNINIIYRSLYMRARKIFAKRLAFVFDIDAIV